LLLGKQSAHTADQGSHSSIPSHVYSTEFYEYFFSAS
jgi:hypothetical protein